MTFWINLLTLQTNLIKVENINEKKEPLKFYVVAYFLIEKKKKINI